MSLSHFISLVFLALSLCISFLSPPVYFSSSPLLSMQSCLFSGRWLCGSVTHAPCARWWRDRWCLCWSAAQWEWEPATRRPSAPNQSCQDNKWAGNSSMQGSTALKARHCDWCVDATVEDMVDACNPSLGLSFVYCLAQYHSMYDEGLVNLAFLSLYFVCLH